MNEIIRKTFETIRQELLNSLGDGYKVELQNIFNLAILDENISVKFVSNNTELFKIIIKKSELLELPKIIQNNVNIIKEKMITETVNRKVMYGDGGDSTIISIKVQNVIVDEFNNPISDEFGNHLVWY